MSDRSRSAPAGIGTPRGPSPARNRPTTQTEPEDEVYSLNGLAEELEMTPAGREVTYPTSGSESTVDYTLTDVSCSSG